MHCDIESSKIPLNLFYGHPNWFTLPSPVGFLTAGSPCNHPPHCTYGARTYLYIRCVCVYPALLYVSTTRYNTSPTSHKHRRRRGAHMRAITACNNRGTHKGQYCNRKIETMFTMLPCCHVAMLPCYHVTMYPIRTQQGPSVEGGPALCVAPP